MAGVATSTNEPTARIPAALLAKGFRPFFLAAGALAATMLPLWLLVFAGVASAGDYLAGAYWHAHEMVFGFAVAVIAGFLLTAVGNWTKRETAIGGPLAALVGLWLLGRVVMSAPGLFPRALPILVDGAFLPALAVVLARPLVAARNRRNYVMLAVLGALGAANVLVHLDALGVVDGWQRRGSLVAVDVVILLIVVIAGRVVPMFTRNATGKEGIRNAPALDRLAAGSMALVVVVELVAPGGAIMAVAAVAAGALTAARARWWGTRHVSGHPLLWILHVGYAWVPVGLFLRAASHVAPALPEALATHALTVGAIGSLTLGMMVRVSLGHTSRPLVASKAAGVAFALITLAALTRAIVPIVWTGPYFETMIAAGTLWAVAFAIFVASYARVLTTPRADGKPG